jgi:3-oxoacyl-[acyl-carrier protein] reductase
MNSETLRDRVAIVIGASRGIGAAIAKSLTWKGAKVALNYLRSRDAAESVVGAIEEDVGHAIAIQAALWCLHEHRPSSNRISPIGGQASG